MNVEELLIPASFDGLAHYYNYTKTTVILTVV